MNCLKKKKGYCEGSKIYYIWKKYLKKELFSKYVGFIHYQRVFDFKNNKYENSICYLPFPEIFG